MKIDLPYISRERGKTGQWFYRFQRYGKKTRIQGEPGSREWHAHYVALRDGAPEPKAAASGGPDKTLPNSFGRLVRKYLDHVATQVKMGRQSELTYKHKARLLNMLVNDLGTVPARSVRRADIIRNRDAMGATPTQADNMVRVAKAMFNWARDMEFVLENPTTGVKKLVPKTDGWKAWTAPDINRFIASHPPGTQPYLAIMLLLFTAARRSDVVHLGWQNMREIDGTHYLVFLPEKKGSSEVQIPVAPQLMDALQKQAHGNATFLVGQRGRPYSAEGFGNEFRKWTLAAGLDGLSAHGVRKGVGGILADGGATNYEIMAIHGHTNPSTSEIYTRSANRRTLAGAAVHALGTRLKITARN